MKKEAIVCTEGGEKIQAMLTEITLVEGDTIIGFLSCEHKVVYIDYIRKMVVIASGDGSVDVLSFDDIVGGYHRVVEDIEFGNIYSVRATISLDVGDVIVDGDGKQYNVDDIEYDNVTVFCSQGEECYTFPFSAFAEGNYMKVVK